MPGASGADEEDIGVDFGAAMVRVLRSGQANGIVSNVVAAIVSIAATHPAAPIMSCINGANTNWPNEPPALMKPAAKERFATGRRCAVAPIRIEKLPAPAPAALKIPIVNSNPHCVSTKGVSAVPSASNTPPAMMTRTAPYLSEIAPNTGCAAPHTN